MKGPVYAFIERNTENVAWVLLLLGAGLGWIARTLAPDAEPRAFAFGLLLSTMALLIFFAGPRAAWPRRDRRGFMSVALPTLCLALIGTFAVALGIPWPWSAIPGLLALGIVGVFWLGGRSVWRPWARYVLHRVHLSTESEFRDSLQRQLRSIIDELLVVQRDPAYGSAGRARAGRLLVGLRELRGPTAEWSDVQARYVRLVERLLDRAQTEDGLESGLREWVADDEVALLKRRVETMLTT